MSISGRASTLLLLAVLLAVGVAIVAWISSAPARQVETPPGAPPTPRPTEEPRPVIDTPPGDGGDRARPPGPNVPIGTAQSSRARYEGRGVIRGEVVARGGATMPERWSLLLEPHPWLEGSEKAETRRIEFEHGESTFRVDDLPLGGYLVRALTSDLNDLPASVLLVRGSPDQFVTLSLQPSGFIDGSVLDEAGGLAEGLDVTLESVETRKRSTVTTDAAGAFLFRDVQDGEYQLYFGRPDSPLLPPEALAFKAPSLRFPTRKLPATGSLKVTVLDESLRPQPRARISGSSKGGSAIDAFADHLGRAGLRFLLPGHYLVDAASEEGLEGSVALDLTAGQELETQIFVRERRNPR